MRLILLLLVAAVSQGRAAPDGGDLYAKNCARCHELLPPLPTREQMKPMTPEFILDVLRNGAMRQVAASLSDEQRKTLAEFLTDKTLHSAPIPSNACGAMTNRPSPNVQWNGWGVDLENSRFQKNPSLTPEQVPHLKLLWAFGFPGAFYTYSQPTVVGNSVYVGSPNGTVYSLDRATGCTHWSFDAHAGVRSAITIGPDNVAYFGDTHANVFALNAETGKQIWKVQVDDYPSARVTGSPKLYQGRLYVPVASREEWFASDPTFECCKFRGSVVALDSRSGKQIWKTYTISEPAQRLEVKRGTQTWGPAGVGVWDSPTIDEKGNVLYVGTGDSYSEPPTPMSDSILAMSLSDGRIVWKQQLTVGDIFTGNCVGKTKTTCPDKAGPDSDFGSSPILHTQPDGSRMLLAGQKSGTLYALDPDHEGRVLWRKTLSKGGLLGGIQWGPAADQDAVYAAISGMAFAVAPEGIIPNPKIGGGLYAVQISTGETLWSALPAPCERHGCSPAQSAAITAIPGVVFSGSLDGHLRAYASKDGTIIWDYDTAKAFDTVNKVPGKGGSLDGPGPVVAGGMVFVNSGYAFFNSMPGNVLLVFGL